MSERWARTALQAYRWVGVGAYPFIGSYVALRASRGKESLVGARSSSSVVWRIFVRAAPVGAPSRPTPKQRFVEGSRIFTILSVAEVSGQELYLECWAEEGSLA